MVYRGYSGYFRVKKLNIPANQNAAFVEFAILENASRSDRLETVLVDGSAYHERIQLVTRWNYLENQTTALT